MTSPLQDVSDALVVALAAVPGVRVYDDPGAAVDPPGLVVGPPTLSWDGVCSDPSDATWTVAVVVAATDRAARQLLGLLPQVVAAVDGVPDAVARRAHPGTWSAGTVELPAYLIDVECNP